MAVNPNIKKKADDIRTKIYGKEVRESLASGLEEMSSDVIENEGRQSVVESRQDGVESQWQSVIDETTNLDVVSAPEIIAARDGEANLKARLDRTTAQLADTANLKGWELQNKTRKQKPLLTIVNDDGYKQSFNILMEMASRLNFNYTEAINGIRFANPEPRFMTVEDVHQMLDAGHEVANHTYNHSNLTELTKEELELDLKMMDDFLKSNGIVCTTAVYPYFENNDSVVESIRKYVRGAKTNRFGINTSPIETWDLRTINGYSPEKPQGKQELIAYYKGLLDETVSKNGWAIFTAHVYMEGDEPEIIEELVNYCRQIGIEVVTFNEGLNRMGNIIDVGRYWKVDLTKPHYVLGSNGTVKDSYDNIPIHYTRGKNITNNTPPNFFEFGNIYKTKILYSDREGFPENQFGLLTTNTETANTYTDHLWQTFQISKSNNTYTRYAMGENTWSSWVLTGSEPIIQTVTGKLSETPLTDFADGKISYATINYSNREGFPSFGALETNRMSVTTNAFQIFHPNQSTDIHKRYWIPATEEWSEWVKLG